MSLRSLNIEINLAGDAGEEMSALDERVAEIKDQFGDLIDRVDTFSIEAANSIEDFGASIADNIANKSNPQIAEMARLLGKTETEVAKLISQTKNDLKLDEDLMNAAKAAGLSDKEFAKLNQTIGKTKESANGFGGVLKAVAATGAIAFMSSFASTSLDAYTALEKERTMLVNLAEDQYPKLENSINKAMAASGGLESEGSLKEAANAALKMGASVDFVSNSLSGMQQAAAITGGSLNGIMEQAQSAILTGSAKFFKENGAIFSQYREQFKQIGSGADQTSIKLREALITKALSQNTALTEQYGKYMETAGARAQIFSQRMGDLKETIGELLTLAIKPLQLALIPVLNYFTDSEKGMGRVKVALIFLSSVIATVVIPNLGAMAIAAWAAVVPWVIMMAPILAIGAGFTFLALVIEDLLGWMDGGESIIGDFLGPFKDFDLVKLFKGMLDRVLNLVKTYGKWIIIAMFPVSALYFFWDEIVAFISGIPDKIVGFFSSMKDTIKSLLKDILPESFISGLKSIGIDLGSNSERVNDAIITKDGKVIHTHPDDNLYAFKSLPGASGGPNPSSTQGSARGQAGGINFKIEIDKVILGNGSVQEDAYKFLDMIESLMDEKLAPKLRKLLGIPEVEY
ncbi:hypothetical protein ND856_14180 [Leptospira bandrabouensis]|uniref:LIC12611 family phage tail protein n=1 Tax=Leptospira bandrabouensis TaxID=2484903 RepID=UPI00223D7964|nr:hypothetical protein [Leptospira bandrabouensis]MCW7459543.1 hypothetical protein [Leptospira bandrabouensis]MCW7478439.1 hypothetical protein [Leptospira bandrabouensis]MCW7486277.1 hypothetical protein [Leptospira bandrabouensis]